MKKKEEKRIEMEGWRRERVGPQALLGVLLIRFSLGEGVENDGLGRAGIVGDVNCHRL